MAVRQISYTIDTQAPVRAPTAARHDRRDRQKAYAAIALVVLVSAAVGVGAWMLSRETGTVGQSGPSGKPSSATSGAARAGTTGAPAALSAPSAGGPSGSAATPQPQPAKPGPADKPQATPPAAPKDTRPAGDARGGERAKAPVDPSIGLADVEHGLATRGATRTVKVGRGDRLMSLLRKQGVSRPDALAAISAMRRVYKPSRIRAGQTIDLKFGAVTLDDKTLETDRFLGFRFDIDNGARTVKVGREGNGPFSATDEKKKLVQQLVRGTATINSSLFVAGRDAGVPAAVLVQLIQIYSFDVDFQREIQRGDGFEVMYRNLYDLDGKLVAQGDILYAALKVRGKTVKLYRFTPKDGRTDYFGTNGASVRKALMRTPIDGARLSSRFGLRRHPILGYTKMHKGIDFAAPRGTPIYAAGDGTVVRRGWFGGYGRYIKIRHNSSYQTAYAHLSRYARGVGVGSRVRQGQIIGFVGSTGRSTGPHLHYEVHYKGRQINPLRIKMPTGRKLKGPALAAFKKRRAELDRMFASIAKDVSVAGVPDIDPQAGGKQKDAGG